MAVFQLTNPLRGESSFRGVSEHFFAAQRAVSGPRRGLAGIPACFVQFLGLKEEDNEDSNPYFRPMHILARLLPLNCDRNSFVTFLVFAMQLKKAFKALLMQKDTRALVVLAWWYGKVCEGGWWIERRARVECGAICIFLEGRCRGDKILERMLRWPRERCGVLNGGIVGSDLGEDWEAGMEDFELSGRVEEI